MLDKEIEKKIENLKVEIEKYNFFYYVKNSPIISDFDFDEKMKKLCEFEKKYPQFMDENSPTNRVNEKPVSHLEIVKHKKKMHSLDNTYNEKEVNDFFERVEKVFPDEKIDWMVELKMDGTAISLIYEKGRLVRAVTRGDGKKGNIVTNAIKTVRSIPLVIPLENFFKISGGKNELEIRGEVYIKKSEFEKINKKRMKNGENLFSNPRNMAAGTLQMLDARIVAERNLHFSPWEIVNSSFKTHFDGLKILMKEGNFTKNLASKIVKNYDELKKVFDNFEKKRNKIDFEYDGLVIKVNDIEKQNTLAYTSKFPRFAIALKFPAMQKTSVVRNIEIQIGRTGAFTPVASFDCVNLGGAMIKKASLYNEYEINRLGIGIGDKIIVERAGDVIPKIIKVVNRAKRDDFIFPKKCPTCKQLGIKNEDDAIRRCVNPDCLSLRFEQILHFVSRSAMDIKTLGKKHVKQFLDNKIIYDFTDLYFLDKEKLLGLERMADLSVKNILDEIENSKKNQFENVIFAIGIRFIGKQSSYILSRKYRNIDNLINADLEDLNETHEIGEKMAVSVFDFFKNEINLEKVKKLKKAGLNFELGKEDEKEKKFNGESFVFTGKISIPREKAKTILKNLGGRVSSSISKKTNFLVCGEKAGKKYEKAKSLGVKIIDENTFLEMVM